MLDPGVNSLNASLLLLRGSDYYGFISKGFSPNGTNCEVSFVSFPTKVFPSLARNKEEFLLPLFGIRVMSLELSKAISRA